MSFKTIDVFGRKIDVAIDYSEPTQDEMDRLLYDDLHIYITVNVSSENDVKVDTHVKIDVNDNYC